MLNAGDARKRLRAAQTLLLEDSTTRAKFTSIRTLIAGIHPKIDEHLGQIDKHLSTWDKVQDGDVIMLSAEHLPENTEEEKKRKKWVLLFITQWRQLKGEVARVQAEFEAVQGAETVGQKASMWGRIFSAAKGPLAVVTVVAVGLAYLDQTAIQMTIANSGCATMHPSVSMPVPIPGLSLPQEPIASGDSVVAEIPGLTVTVDGTTPGMLSLKVLTYELLFQLPSNISDVTLNGASLLGTQTEVKLSEAEEHTLILTCS